MTLWHAWLQLCPYAWRDALVPGWKELRTFVEEWLAAPPDVIRPPAVTPPRQIVIEGTGQHIHEESPTVAISREALQNLEEDAAPATMTRRDVAYRHLGGRGPGPMRLRIALQRIGSFSKAFALVHRNRELTPEERQRFATHAMPADLVDWQHIASGTAGALGALYMAPNGVEE